MIVIGGGIAGLALSLALLKDGRRVTLCEQASAFSPVGAGITLSPSACKALAWLGLEDGLARLAEPGSPPVLRDWSTGNAGTTMAAAKHLSDTRRISRADLHALLLDAAKRHPDFEALTGSRLSNVEQSASGVTATMDDGREIAGSLLFGADGARSVVRDAVFGEAAPEFTGYVAWRFMLPADAATLLHMAGHSATITAGPDASLTCYTVGQGKLLNCVAITHSDEWAAEGWSERGDPAALEAIFATAHPDARALVALAGDVGLYRWGLFDRPVVPRWHSGRVALLGDAAHPILPFLAFGAGLAIEDAVVLGRALSSFPTDEAFDRYEAARRPRAAMIHAASRKQAEAFAKAKSGDLPEKSPMLSPEIFGYDPVAVPL